MRYLEESMPSLKQQYQSLSRGIFFFTKIKKLTKHYKNLCKAKAMQFCEEELHVRHKMEAASHALQVGVF